MFCNSLTKLNQPCKMRVSVNTEPFNGMRLCHVHLKSEKNRNHEDNLNNQQNSVMVYSNLNSSVNVYIKPKRCKSKTKKGCKCTKKTTHESGLCHVHQNKKNEKEEKEIENVANSIVSMIKSPCINYKTNKKSDCCFVCLEETDNKLSCGHFIHTNCLINMLLSNIKKNYRVFEHKNNYFIITNCLYCKQISIMKNIPMTEKLERKYDARKNKMKINNATVSHYFSELFLRYDTYDTKEHLDMIEIEFMEELKQLIFDNFSTIVFDNYIQQKNISNITLKYEKIDKKTIMNNIKKVIEDTLYSRYIYDKIKNKLEMFIRILENVVLKMIEMDNVQDDLLSLVNVF